MSRFSTEFPVSQSVTKEEFLDLVKKWLVSSSNSKFTTAKFNEKIFFESNKFDKWELGNEILSYISIGVGEESELAIK